MIDPADIDLAEFLTTWHGPPTKCAITIPSSFDWLPSSLRGWHSITSQWDARLTFMTNMVSLERIKVADDGMAIFMLDPTGDWRWCFDPAEPDTVLGAEEYEVWKRIPEPFAEFLVHCAVKDVFYGTGATMRAFAVQEEALSEILRPLEEIAFAEWQWPSPGYRNFMGENLLVEIVRSKLGTGWQVKTAATDFDRLSVFENTAEVHWRK
ncbi:hypothetical protein [Embleya sp. NPDC005971]|uniref:hypothetical protein n=1 Tax=Embleya sp. NPDC005971 TaxID=3156724 RepID=UPI00340D5E57